ncbi:MAG: sensor histidine kinase [Parapedobacter sp.]|nr:MAG: sensor histidine kinase [Parapedobacter sp.]
MRPAPKKDLGMNKEQLDVKSLDFYSTADLIVTPVMLTDEKYAHLFRNQAFYDQIGYGMDEVYDRKTWFEKAFPDASYRDEAKRLWDEQLQQSVSENQRHIQLLARVYCKNRQYRWYEIHEYPLGNYRVVTFIDVDDLQTKNEGLLKIIKFNNLLSATIAHDIRAPLATLKSLIQFKNRITDESQINLKNLFSRVDSQVNRIFDIIDSSMLHHSDELQHFRFRQQKIFLDPFIKKIQSYYEEEMKSWGKKWVTNVSGHDHIYYDAFILEVILRNIFSNAVKYTPPMESITVDIETAPHYTDIHIEDRGGGIAEEELSFLQNPLVEHKRNGKTDLQTGFGIGLLISKDMLESHWGKLMIESTSSVGSRFTVRIPSYIPQFSGEHK